ncbi:armadillo-type protein [Lentinula aciculospora]|uniref:Armadillo-type protein n=1 Tax=Lentinula aciculospora TaxID=153920 RepID=A0A9W9ATW1_9AGAR|nr:armadillo-type protein [Lentinula aciculospora]
MAITGSSSSSSSSSRNLSPSLSELKQIKNRIIGTPSAKCRLTKDHATMRMLAETTMDVMMADDVRTETAQILGSLASLGGHTVDAIVLAALIEEDALRCCLSALATTTPTQRKLRLALARALSGISGDFAELLGPPQFGLGAFEAQWLTGAASQTLEWFFGSEAMDIWIPMLSGAEAGVAANMIGTVVRTQPVRERICAWRNAGEREKKERRGWEATKPSTSGAFVLRTLLDLTGKKETLGNALFALAALAKDNPAVANELPLQDIVNHAKFRSGDIQLSACLCATHILRTSPGQSPAAEAILSVLLATIADETIHSAKAAFVLSQLLTDSPVYAQLAFDRGALRILLTILRRLTPPSTSIPPLPPLHLPTPSLFTGPEWESWIEYDLDQPKADIRLREAILLSLASISLFSNDIRRVLAEDEGESQSTFQSHASTASPCSTQSQPSLSLILAGLLSPHACLRCAACHVVRALTRSVAVIRTNIVDSGLGWLVFAAFMGWPQARPRTVLGSSGPEEEDIRVVSSALRAVCNAVCEFSPLKSIYIEHGLLPRLAEFIHPDNLVSDADSDADPEDSLQLNSLWAVKNLVRKSGPATKRQVINVLGWHHPKVAVYDPKLHKRSRLDEILEQVLNILCNLAEDEEGISIVFNELDFRNSFFSPSTPSDHFDSSSTDFPLLSHLSSILAYTSSPFSSSHPTHNTPVSHPSYSFSQDVLIQSASLLANLVNSLDLKHHRMILTCPGMVHALRRVLAEQGPDVRRPVIRAVLEMIKVDLGVALQSVASIREVGHIKNEDGAEGTGAGVRDTEVIQEEDDSEDSDMMETGYRTRRPVTDQAVNLSPAETGRVRTYSHSRNEGFIGARKILIDAGFVGTLRRIVDQHYHHSSLVHPHPYVHPQAHTSAAATPAGHGHMGSGAGVHNQTHVQTSHHQFGSLDSSGAGVGGRGGPGNVGAISGIIGNAGREDREDLETARMTLDWLEHGDKYMYLNTYRRVRPSSVNTGDNGAGVSESLI